MKITYEFKGVSETRELGRKPLVVGRSEGKVLADVDLAFDGAVSHRHARLWFEDGRYWIEDLGSRNDTLLDGERIKGKGRFPLDPGRSVKIGNTNLKIEAEVEADPPPPRRRGTRAADDGAGGVDIAATIDAEAPAFGTQPANGADARREALLYELPLRFGEHRDLDGLLQAVIERVVAIMPGARHGALLLKDPASGRLLLKAHVPSGTPSVSMDLARRAMAQRQGFIWRKSGDLTRSQVSIRIEAGMYMPLLWQGEAVGVVCVDNDSPGVTFNPEDLRLMLAVAHHAAMAAVHHRLQEELRRNTAILSRLLTNFSPKIRDQLLARARHGRLRLGGERSEVAILESDIRGFTRLSAGLEPDDVVDLLNDYFSALVDVIFKYDGTIDKFVGDAILAVFGSPEPDPARHEKAVEAAVAMQAAMQEVSRRRKLRGLPTAEIGVGIHCGEVLHGFIGSADRMEFTIIGDAVNRTARFCDGAGLGEVLMSPELHQHTWNMVDADPVVIGTKHEGDFRAYRVKAITRPSS